MRNAMETIKTSRTNTEPNGTPEEIKCYAFEASTITSMLIPTSVKKIGQGAFKSCRNLNTVTLPDGIEHIPSDMFAESTLKKIIIPKTLQTIGYKAFFQCSNLRNLELNPNLKVIEESAFEGSGLEYIILTSKNVNVDRFAFLYCESLRYIIVPDGSMEQIYNNLHESSREKVIKNRFYNKAIFTIKKLWNELDNTLKKIDMPSELYSLIVEYIADFNDIITRISQLEIPRTNNKNSWNNFEDNLRKNFHFLLDSNNFEVDSQPEERATFFS